MFTLGERVRPDNGGMHVTAPAAAARGSSTVPAPVVRLSAILSLIANVVIVFTGGLVRLTQSGLGCTTWPNCTPESLVWTPEQGVHGLIEFGNRTLTGVLVAVALFALWAVWTRARSRRDLLALAWTQVIGILVQAVLGGVLVHVLLPWYLVGVHYVLSAALVALMSVFVHRSGQPELPRERVVALPVLVLTHATTGVLAVAVVVGTLATGSGPHSGDSSRILRTGFDATAVYHVHAWSGYVLFALTLAVLIAAVATRAPQRFTRAGSLLLAGELVQIAVGLWQVCNGLPIGLISVHLVLAALLVSAGTFLVLETKRPIRATDEAAPEAPNAVVP